ncbi:Hsp70 family protein [Paenibacillus arenosi]|uniref:Chaperone protein DnaK n=1 Tax=Paenibacillus arenosi TaxID=2774142 RepID=A0ABR9AXD8_9BACL|nr:Hsp70 family protein [Paenibacillus arenosi]MBD8498780.1 Hsp70 family protein [Paenibacillus arenosi]
MIIGIDLGTTFSAAAYVDKDGIPVIIPNREGKRTSPSVILFEQSVPVVGSKAKDEALNDPLNVVQFVKRQIGNTSYSFLNEAGEAYSPEELSAIILKRLKQDAEDHLGTSIHHAVITVPAYFDDVQRKATKDAGKIAGLNVVKILNEPTAAALAYGISQQSEDQDVMVFDLGGGTFDVTIMSISNKEIIIKATGGDRNLGGFDFDNKIIEYVHNQFLQMHQIDLYDDPVALQQLREMAEECKKSLSIYPESSFMLSSQGKTLRVALTRDSFVEMIRPLLNRTSIVMRNVLQDSGMEWADLEKILLVGGSTRIPAVREWILETSGIVPSDELHPDEVVALGAAIQADLLNDKQSRMMLKPAVVDVNSHSLGIISLDPQHREQNSIILPRNTPIPAKKSDVFITMEDRQDNVSIVVTEGEDTDPNYVRVIGQSTIQLDRPPKGHEIRVTLSYDADGIVHVTAQDEQTGKDMGEFMIDRKSNLSEPAIEDKTRRFTDLTIN